MNALAFGQSEDPNPRKADRNDISPPSPKEPSAAKFSPRANKEEISSAGLMWQTLTQHWDTCDIILQDYFAQVSDSFTESILAVMQKRAKKMTDSISKLKGRIDAFSTSVDGGGPEVLSGGGGAASPPGLLSPSPKPNKGSVASASDRTPSKQVASSKTSKKEQAAAEEARREEKLSELLKLSAIQAADRRDEVQSSVEGIHAVLESVRQATTLVRKNANTKVFHDPTPKAICFSEEIEQLTEALFTARNLIVEQKEEIIVLRGQIRPVPDQNIGSQTSFEISVSEEVQVQLPVPDELNPGALERMKALLMAHESAGSEASHRTSSTAGGLHHGKRIPVATARSKAALTSDSSGTGGSIVRSGGMGRNRSPGGVSGARSPSPGNRLTASKRKPLGTPDNKKSIASARKTGSASPSAESPKAKKPLSSSILGSAAPNKADDEVMSLKAPSVASRKGSTLFQATASSSRRLNKDDDVASVAGSMVAGGGGGTKLTAAALAAARRGSTMSTAAPSELGSVRAFGGTRRSGTRDSDLMSVRGASKPKTGVPRAQSQTKNDDQTKGVESTPSEAGVSTTAPGVAAKVGGGKQSLLTGNKDQGFTLSVETIEAAVEKIENTITTLMVQCAKSTLQWMISEAKNSALKEEIVVLKSSLTHQDSSAAQVVAVVPPLAGSPFAGASAGYEGSPARSSHHHHQGGRGSTTTRSGLDHYDFMPLLQTVEELEGKLSRADIRVAKLKAFAQQQAEVAMAAEQKQAKAYDQLFAWMHKHGQGEVPVPQAISMQAVFGTMK